MITPRFYIVFALLTAIASPVLSQAGNETSLKNLPANKWVKLKTRPLRGYEYSQPIFVPSRKQVLHWGVVRQIYQVPEETRNDVIAFDPKAMDWLSDYPSAKDLPHNDTIHTRGKGIYYEGIGEMLECGTPAPSAIVNGVCYDSKRDQLIYTMKGLMAAYDPNSKTWRDMKAKTILFGKEYPGGPPVYGIGTCYDPVNDEILLFPHYAGRDDPRNIDRVDVDGRVSSHFGTFRFSFKDNTWRQVGHTFRSDLQKARSNIKQHIKRLSVALDIAYRIRRKPTAKAHKDLQKIFNYIYKKVPADSLEGSKRAKNWRLPNHKLLQNAAILAGEGKVAQALKPAAEALRNFVAILDRDLRVEPEPRCAAPMVYDEKNQKIVLFGGHSGEVRTDLYFKQPKFRYYPGSLNDTWLYDVKTKEWEQLDLHGPVLTRMPKLFYDPKSGLVLHFTFENYAKPKDSPALCTVETLDVAKKQWYSPQYVPFPAKLQYQSTYSNRTPIFNVAFDPENRLVLLFQNVRDGKEVRQETYAMRLKLKEPKGKGVRWSKPEPVKPQVIPKDDPEWLNKLKTFPANRWTYTDPQPRDARVRDWGNMAVDPVRNLVFYFGGGHSTYQVNDVAIYAPGANKWISAAGDHNDFVPPVGWGGNTMGYRGGPNAHHMRNQYVALDGRMFYGPLWNEQLKCHLVWFYDLDRGGVWRWKKIAKVTIDKGGEKIISRPHMVDPSGKVLSFQVVPKGRYISGVLGWYFSSYDIYENRLTIKAIPKPWPGRVPECRPFCLLPHRQQIFYYEYNPKRSDDIEHFRFWMYDIKQNKCRQLHPKRKPPKGVAKVVVYLPKQNAILADVRTKNRESENMWVYSLKRNDWTKLPVVGDKSRFVGPYGQMDYLPEYGVVINVNRRTVVMPPDVEKLDWQGE